MKLRKYIIALTSIMLLSCGATANATESEEDIIIMGEITRLLEEQCVTYSSFAETVMEQRQKGMPLQEQARVAKGLNMWHGVYRAVILDAYDEPQWGTAESKRNAASEFSSKVHLICLKEVEKIQ